MEPKRALILNPADNVANVLENVNAGDLVAARKSPAGETVTIQALEDIPFGFKVALVDIEPGQFVIKYGEVIGKASRPISRGALVHIHNLEGTRGRGDLQAAATQTRK